MLSDSRALAEYLELDQIQAYKPLIIFDEIHEFSKWKLMIKGFYDNYKLDCNVLITGSARMDVFKKGGDSLMGRYLSYRLHPLSVGETLDQSLPDKEISVPSRCREEDYQTC